ncbi:MAG: winged helix-turn-helix transcriptional regulator [Haloferacaceae archaeon]
MAETDGEEGLDDLPPSAKLVYKVLEYDGPLTQKGIVEESMLSARTVRYALERLEEIGVVDEDVYFADARQNLYQLTEPIEADGGVDVDEETEGADAEETPHAECD